MGAMCGKEELTEEELVAQKKAEEKAQMERSKQAAIRAKKKTKRNEEAGGLGVLDVGKDEAALDKRSEMGGGMISSGIKKDDDGADVGSDIQRAKRVKDTDKFGAMAVM